MNIQDSLGYISSINSLTPIQELIRINQNRHKISPNLLTNIDRKNDQNSIKNIYIGKTSSYGGAFAKIKVNAQPVNSCLTTIARLPCKSCKNKTEKTVSNKIVPI
ncbi:hypothetical protein [Campylobacter hyointestinalis]|uniref:hypothetical protein n=1 Tax=Campylobacter hyointestinalis TaxID=198 RepID=UPI000DCCB968|nr:hypothetical protein [Campylobacter hyointestinalis]RAZ60516.1 hypothetical protein CHL10071_05505 [Campylobacter hyointestinalis subsp. lawsonii]